MLVIKIYNKYYNRNKKNTVINLYIYIYCSYNKIRFYYTI